MKRLFFILIILLASLSIVNAGGYMSSKSGSGIASGITNTPAGNIAAIDVQSAINELDTEKAAANASTTGSAGSLKSPATTGLMTVTGMGAGQTRAKTVRDAADTIVELGTTLGTFTGSTIADNATAQGALQSLETAVEGKQASGSYQTDMGITAKSDSTSTTSSTSVASSTAVKAAYDQAIALGVFKVVGGGTADAITASPTITLVDGTIIFLRSVGTNTVTNPTIALDGGAARTIYKQGAQALVAGDIPVSPGEAILKYNLANTRWELLNPVYPPGLSGGTDGTYVLRITNNTTRAPTGSANELYPEANVWKINQNGTEYATTLSPTAGQVTISGPSAPRTWTAPDANVTIPANPIGGTLGATTNIIPKASGTGTATLQASGITEDGTNVDIGGLNLLTTGTISGKFVVVNGGAADLNLTVAQVKGTVISNTGQGPNNRNHTLPVAEAGLFFLGTVGEAQAASYYRFTANTTPTPDDFMCLDGTCGKTYVSIAAPTQGAQVACHTEQIASTGIVTGAALGIGTTNTNVANGAFTFDIAGTGYAKTATAAGTAFNAITTVQNKYGAQAFDIGADGTIDPISGTNIATGFNTAAEAAADLPEVAAAHVRMGYVTVMRSNIAGFVWGTTALSDAETTEAYTSSTAYTKPYNWLCNKSVGTWVTN